MFFAKRCKAHLSLLTAVSLGQFLLSSCPVFAQEDSGAVNVKPTVQTRDASSAIDSFSDIDNLLANGKYKEAHLELTKLVDSLKKTDKTAELINAYQRLSIVQKHLGECVKSERTLKFASGILKPGEDDFEGHSNKARILFYLSDILDEVGQYKESGHIVKQGIEAVRNLTIQGKLPYLETELLNIDARMLITQGNLDEAKELLSEASYMMQSLPDTPKEFNIKGSSLSQSKNFLKAKIASTEATLLEAEGKIAKAIAKGKEAADLFKESIEDALDDPRYATLVFRYSENPEQYKDKIEPTSNLTKAAYLAAIAQRKKKENNFKEAISLMEEVYRMRSRELETSSAIVGNTLIELASLYHETGNFQNATALATRGYEALARSEAQTSPAIARATATLAKAHLAQGVTDGVEPLLNHAWKVEAKRLGNDSPEVLEILEALSDLYLKQKNYRKAIQVGSPVTSKLEKEYGTTSLELIPTLTTTGNAFANLKQYKKGSELLNRAKAILEKNGKTKTPEYADILASIGVNETLQYKWKYAKINLQKAIDLCHDLYGESNPKTIAMRRLYKSMDQKRKTVPGLNKNILKTGNFKPMAPDSFQQ